MCALRAYNSIPFLEKVLSEIEKMLTTFSISDKIFPKIDLLMHALRASTLDVVNVPNVKYLAHLPHQTPKNLIYQMFQIS